MSICHFIYFDEFEMTSTQKTFHFSRVRKELKDDSRGVPFSFIFNYFKKEIKQNLMRINEK